MIPDHYFDEGINNSLLRKDMKHVQLNRVVYDQSQRDYEREQRNLLSSQDGNTCEIHDQFYRDHKLLLVLFRALAVMPITRSRPGTITFSWRSRATAYAIFFYIVTTVVVLVVGYERVMILRATKKFDDYIYSILFVAFLVPHFWIPFVGWGVAHQVAIYKTNWGKFQVRVPIFNTDSYKFDDYIYSILFVAFLVPHFWIPFVGWGVAHQVAIYETNWGKFQVRYYRITGENLQFPNLKTSIVIISAGCLLLAVGFLLSLCALLDGFLLRHTTAYYHIITMINMNCALWYINCRGIKIASQSLSKCFHRGEVLQLAVGVLLSLCALLDGFLLRHTTVYYHIITMINMNCALWYINCRGIKIASQSLSKCFHRDVRIECTASLISSYRYLWLNLSEQLQSLGNAYARTYSTYCLFMFFNITIAVYGALSEIVDHGFQFSFKEMGLFVDAAYCSTLLFIFADCSHKSTLQVAAGVQDTLLSIDVLSVDRPTQKEIDHFIQAIEMNPAVVSLKGYANVNRELLTSAISMIAIYLIVLLQFKISLPKDPTTNI